MHGRIAEKRPRRRGRRRETGGEGEVEQAGLRDGGADQRRADPHRAHPPAVSGAHAAQNASCPPAECPTATTRDEIERRVERRRGGRRRQRRPGSVAGHPPPDPTRRYSRFHAASPCAARSRQRSVISERSYWAFQYPPWTTTTTAKRPGARREEELPELARVGAVRSASSGSCARQDSNLRPRAPEARALSPELRARGEAVYRRPPCRIRRRTS